MSFWDDQAEADPLTELLQSPNPQLSDVLNDASMLQELRSGNAELIAYLTREDVVSQLCEWSMTLTHESDKDFDRTSRFAIEALTCGNALASQLLHSSVLKQFLTDFLANPADWEALCAGHFHRILVHLLNESSGAYLNNFPGIIEGVVKHLSLLGVAELLISLAIKYSDALPKPIVPVLVQFIGESPPPHTAALYALRQIFADGWIVPEFAASFTAPETLSKLAAIAKSGRDRATTVELYRLIGKIRGKGAAVGPIEAPAGEADGSVAAFARAVNVGDLREGLLLIARKAVHFGLGNVILAAVKALPQDEFVAAAIELGIVELLTAAFEEDRLTGQQLELINLLVNGSLEFVATLPQEAVIKAGKLNAQYGGELPIGTPIGRQINAD
jgi:hypothetical protein